MERVELVAQVRTERGSGAARRLRRTGWVTANVYGKGIEPVALQIDAKKLREVLGPTGEGHNLLTLRVDPATGADGMGSMAYTAVVKEVQRNPLTRQFLTVDFQHVSLTERITATVALVLQGTPIGTKEGGIVEHFLHEVEVQCQAQHLPERIEHDISGVKMQESVHVRDLRPLPGVTILNDGDEVVIAVTPPRVVEEVAPTEAAETLAEPEVIQRGKKDKEEEEE